MEPKALQSSEPRNNWIYYNNQLKPLDSGYIYLDLTTESVWINLIYIYSLSHMPKQMTKW